MGAGPVRAAAAVVASALLLAGCSSPRGAERSSEASSELAGVELWVNPDSTAARAEQQLREGGQTATAEAVSRIAEVPTATWFGGEGDPRGKAEEITRAAAEAGQVPVLVAYNLPERDCGQYSKGGAGSDEEYRTWTREVAAGIGDREAVVVLEPDAIAHAVVGCDGAPAARDRYQLLAEAVGVFADQPGVRVYLDAGNATWIDDVDKLAGALEESGVADAAGFALNVSNFVPTEPTYAYGERVSRSLGGDVRFIIDTSRNGGSTPDGDWCNPEGAKLGEPPVTSPPQPLLDALLWVKQPGDSDGECKDGAPPAGQWWQQSAEALLT